MKHVNKLIIEAGGTKCDVALIHDGSVMMFDLPGINIATMDFDYCKETIEILAKALEDIFDPEIFTLVTYYGAGIVSRDDSDRVFAMINPYFPNAEVRVYDDIEAAAMASLGKEPGVVAMLGTGSNSAEWNGKKVVKVVRSGGYILGEEGSAAALGKALMADMVKGLVPRNVETEFVLKFGYRSYERIINEVYRSSTPASNLGVYAPWILEQAQNYPYLHNLVMQNLEAFVSRSLKQHALEGKTIAVVGSYGYACKKYIDEIAAREGFKVSKYVEKPLEVMVEYGKR